MTVPYAFTVEQFKENDGLISLPCSVTIGTEELTKDLTNLTNYKVEAVLTITEEGSQAEATEKTTDFFVYTVTKLKYDL